MDVGNVVAMQAAEAAKVIMVMTDKDRGSTGEG